MCDLAPIFTLLTVGEVAIIAAIASCVVAIALNASFFGAAGAPIAFGITLALALVASMALAAATGMLANCGAQQCLTEQTNVTAWFAVMTGTLATGIAMAYVIIFSSGVPVIGAAAMGVCGAFLVAAAGMLLSAVDSLRLLQVCMAVPPPALDGAAGALAGVATAVAIIGALIVLFISGKAKDPKDPTKPNQ